ncbi:MAG: TIGR03435 family protein [Acidobacteriaceae bacterium]
MWVVLAAQMAYSQSSAKPGGDGVQNAGAPSAAADPTMGIAFDVVTIKPSGPQSSYYGVRTLPEGDSLSADNFTVDDMVRWAYHLGHRWGEPDHPDVPKWYASDRYDIRAKVAAEDVDAWHKLNEEGRRLVLRKVLAERFKLVCHFENVEMPVYNLVIAKSGLKMTEAKPGEVSPYHFHSPGDPSMAYTGPGMTMRDTPNGPLTVFQRMDMAEFEKSDVFAYTLDRPVIDKTGLTGVYNFELDFSYQPITAAPSQDGVAAEPSSPDIFTALQKQLGLKLEPARGPVQQLIIDHVERPSED